MRMRKEKLAVLGGSRGLGLSIVKALSQQGYEIFVASRKPLSEKVETVTWRSFDFSQEEQASGLIEALNKFSPDTVIYCAGGGPYGLYGEKEWKDQEWSLNVTFRFPAFLLWQWCRGKTLQSVQKFIVMGSAVAESQPDPKASMYCASKHALKGLISSLAKEYPHKQIKLFSPPYMDTDLLPPGAWPRQSGLAQQPSVVAEEFLRTVLG